MVIGTTSTATQKAAAARLVADAVSRIEGDVASQTEVVAYSLTRKGVASAREEDAAFPAVEGWAHDVMVKVVYHLWC